MKILVTGHHGYIGSVMSAVLQDAGHHVVGLDMFFYRGCDFGPGGTTVPALELDVRDVGPENLSGFDAVVHLAALSNDPLGISTPRGPTPSTSTERSGPPGRRRTRAWGASSSPPRVRCTAPRAKMTF